MSNVTPIRPGANIDLGLDQLADPGGPLQPRPGALSRLMRGLGIDDKLAPIAAVKRIDEMPVSVGIPISHATPDECRCPSCRLYEKEAHAPLCPKCTLRAEIRQMNADQRRKHYECIDREVSEREAMRERAEAQVRRDANMIQAYSDRQSLIAQLDEWDSEWRDHYGTIESAECNYLRAIKEQP